MTKSAIDLARECGADVTIRFDEAAFGIEFTPAQLDAFAERIRAAALSSASAQPDHFPAFGKMVAQPDHRAVMQRAYEWMSKQGEIVFAFGGMPAVDEMIEIAVALRQAIEAAQPSPAAMEPMAYPPMPAPVVHWTNPLPLVGGGVVQAATYYSADQMRAYVAADRALRPQTLQQERQPMDPKEAYHLLVEWTNEDGDWLALLRKVEKHHGITAQQGGE